MSHGRRLFFERWQEQLRIQCPWMVQVEQDAPGLHNRNALPWSRLYFIPSAVPLAKKSTIGKTLKPSTVTDVARRQQVVLQPGRLVLLPAHRLYAFDFEPGLRMAAAHFRLEWAPGCDAFADDVHMRAVDDQCELVDRAWTAVSDDSTLRAVVALRGMLFAGCAPFLTQDQTWMQEHLLARRRLAPLLDRLEADPRADWSTATAARLLGVSREHCSRTFRALVGVSLREHRDRRLMEHAGRHLLAGLSVATVAEILGFASPFALSRSFKRQTGLSPSHFARGLVT